MNESGRSTSGGRTTSRWLSAMTVAEIALAIVLVAGAGWLVRGFANLRNTDLGFRTDKRLIFDVSFLGAKYPDGDAVRDGVARPHRETRRPPWCHERRRDLELPIAEYAGELAHRAVSRRDRRPRAPDRDAAALRQPRVLRVDGHDLGGQVAISVRTIVNNTTPVAIVNRTFVKRYLAGRDPIGVRFSAGYPAPDPRNEVLVVGVVDDVRQKTVSDEAEPAFYSPLTRFPLRRQTVVVASSANDAAILESAIREEVRRLDPQIAVEFERVSDLVAGTIRRQQLGMTLMLIFGGVAILLAAVGIYGVVAYAVSQRRGEMATRLALGATPGSVFWLVMKQGGTLAAIGTAIGLAIAYLSGRVVASQIYTIRASDPLMLGAAIVLVVGITAFATMIPAWRAARLAPSGVLHAE